MIIRFLAIIVFFFAGGAMGAELGPPFYSGAILPTPRDAAYREGEAVLLDAPAGGKAAAVEMRFEGPAAPLIQRLLGARIAEYLPGATLSGAPGPGAVPVIIALASDSQVREVAARHGLEGRLAKLPEQGYLLDIRPEGVLCAGGDNTGVLYAVASLLQLTHVQAGRLVARCATVCDGPAFTTRFTSEYHLPGTAFFDWMMLNKINGFAACYRGMRWEGLSEEKRAGLKSIGEYIREYQTLRFMVQFHVGGRAGRAVDCGNAEDVARLLDTIRAVMELTPTAHVMICYDDVVPQLQPEESKQFSAPAEAHGALMEQVYQAVKAEDSGTVVSFCTPFYQGRGHKRWVNKAAREMGLDYLKGVGAWLNPDIRIVWTGPVTESREISHKDIEIYQEWLGRKAMLTYWDNTWHYHQPLRNFHAQYPEDFLQYCADKTSYINVNGVGAIGRYFAVTANDYYWNSGAFNAERAWHEAVIQFMGPEAVPAAAAFYALRGDDYFSRFMKAVDLEVLKKVFIDLEAASRTPDLPRTCWDVYKEIVKRRASGSGGVPGAEAM